VNDQDPWQNVRAYQPSRGATAATGVMREAAVMPHHPQHRIMLERGQNLREKLDRARGFTPASPSLGTGATGSTPDRTQSAPYPPSSHSSLTPPVVVKDAPGLAAATVAANSTAWLPHINPTGVSASVGLGITHASPDARTTDAPQHTLNPHQAHQARLQHPLHAQHPQHPRVQQQQQQQQQAHLHHLPHGHLYQPHRQDPSAGPSSRGSI
jgi:hypothetical protein